jgi:hypothetical protein
LPAHVLKCETEVMWRSRSRQSGSPTKSIVGSDGARFDLSEVASLHTEYGIRRSEFYERHPNDRRLKQKFAGSRREKERIKQALSTVSKQIVERALKSGQAIVPAPQGDPKGASEGQSEGT